MLFISLYIGIFITKDRSLKFYKKDLEKFNKISLEYKIVKRSFQFERA